MLPHLKSTPHLRRFARRFKHDLRSDWWFYITIWKNNGLRQWVSDDIPYIIYIYIIYIYPYIYYGTIYHILWWKIIHVPFSTNPPNALRLFCRSRWMPRCNRFEQVDPLPRSSELQTLSWTWEVRILAGRKPGETMINNDTLKQISLISSDISSDITEFDIWWYLDILGTCVITNLKVSEQSHHFNHAEIAVHAGPWSRKMSYDGYMMGINMMLSYMMLSYMISYYGIYHDIWWYIYIYMIWYMMLYMIYIYIWYMIYDDIWCYHTTVTAVTQQLLSS